MPYLSGGFVPQGALPQQGTRSIMPPPGAANPMAPAVDGSQAGGPGQGGAATAEVAQAQVPGAREAAGMPPAPAPGQAGVPPAPGQEAAPGAPPPVPGQLQPPPAPPSGFVPNSRGEQLYPAGEGPVTETVPPELPMITPPLPQGAAGAPIGSTGAAGLMTLQAAAYGPRRSPQGLSGRLAARFVSHLKKSGRCECEDGQTKNLLAISKAKKTSETVQGLHRPFLRAKTSPEVERSQKKFAVIGSHGVPLVSTDGPLRRSSVGEGDISSLKLAPWQINGAKAFDSVSLRQPTAKGFTSFGKLSADLSPMARAFLDRCVTGYGMSGEQVVEAAKTASLISEDVAGELEPLVKAAQGAGIARGIGAGAMKHIVRPAWRGAKGLLGFGKAVAPKGIPKARELATKAPRTVPPPLPRVAPKVVPPPLPKIPSLPLPRAGPPPLPKGPGFLSKAKGVATRAKSMAGAPGRYVKELPGARGWTARRARDAALGLGFGKVEEAVTGEDVNDFQAALGGTLALPLIRGGGGLAHRIAGSRVGKAFGALPVGRFLGGGAAGGKGLVPRVANLSGKTLGATLRTGGTLAGIGTAFTVGDETAGAAISSIGDKVRDWGIDATIAASDDILYRDQAGNVGLNQDKVLEMLDNLPAEEQLSRIEDAFNHLPDEQKQQAITSVWNGLPDEQKQQFIGDVAKPGGISEWLMKGWEWIKDNPLILGLIAGGLITLLVGAMTRSPMLAGAGALAAGAGLLGPKVAPKFFGQFRRGGATEQPPPAQPPTQPPAQSPVPAGGGGAEDLAAIDRLTELQRAT